MDQHAEIGNLGKEHPGQWNEGDKSRYQRNEGHEFLPIPDLVVAGDTAVPVEDRFKVFDLVGCRLAAVGLEGMQLRGHRSISRFPLPPPPAGPVSVPC